MKNGGIVKKPFFTGLGIGTTFYGFNKAYQWPVDLIERAENILEKGPTILNLPSGLPPIPR